VNILLDNVLQCCSWDAKIFYFLLKKLFNVGTRMGWGYPNPLGTGIRFNFSSPLGMGRVTGKYMRIGYGDGEGKTRPHSASLSCLLRCYDYIFVYFSTKKCLFFVFFKYKYMNILCGILNHNTVIQWMYFQLVSYDMIHHFNNLDQWIKTKSKWLHCLY